MKQNAKSPTIIAVLSISISSSLSSCMTTKTGVGAYRETIGTEYIYAKAKQIWLFWRLMP